MHPQRWIIVSLAEVPQMPSRAEIKPQQFEPLDRDVGCELLVVGSGIASLSAAYEADPNAS